MIQGFKEFIARGNAIDLAVGVIIGGAFTKVVTALVEQVINPLVGAVFGQPDFTQVGQFEISLLGDPAVVRPGAVITALVNFLLVAVALYFCIVLPLNALNRRQKAAAAAEAPVGAAADSAEVELLREIRDALQQNRV